MLSGGKMIQDFNLEKNGMHLYLDSFTLKALNITHCNQFLQISEVHFWVICCQMSVKISEIC